MSSLGRGVPSEVVRSSEGETEKSGEAGAKVWGIGAKGRYSGFDRNAIETTLQITAPYRFQDLIDELDKNDIDVYENPDPRSVARGDVVRIDGSAKTHVAVQIRSNCSYNSRTTQLTDYRIDGRTVQQETGRDS